MTSTTIYAAVPFILIADEEAHDASWALERCTEIPWKWLGLLRTLPAYRARPIAGFRAESIVWTLCSARVDGSDPEQTAANLCRRIQQQSHCGIFWRAQMTTDQFEGLEPYSPRRSGVDTAQVLMLKDFESPDHNDPARFN